MIRTFNSEFLDSVAQTMAAKILLNPGQSLDVLVKNQENVVLVDDVGGFIFVKHMPGIYEVHTIYPAKSGALGAAKKAAVYMFSHTDCIMIRTRVPLENEAAKKLTLAMGFEQVYSSGGMECFELDIDRWVRSSGECRAEGDRFHHMIGDHKNHEDDDAHDSYAGAGLIIGREQPEKGLALYNRWAVFTGYKQLKLLSNNPIIVDMDDAIIHIRGDDVEVISCQ